MWKRRWVRWFGWSAIGGVVASGTLLTLLLGSTPAVGDARRRADAQAVEHGAGEPVTHLPARLADAVLAVEDHRFYGHPGVDVLALSRFAVGVAQGRDAGGSTIELQLAKVLYTGDGHGAGQVVDRLGIALKLAAHYRKRDILLIYLNTVYFGHGYYGVAAAARGYFGRAPDDLDWAQAALLAGLLQSPDGYDPFLHPELATARRHHVFDRLRAVGDLSTAEATRYDSMPLGLAAS